MNPYEMGTKLGPGGEASLNKSILSMGMVFLFWGVLVAQDTSLHMAAVEDDQARLRTLIENGADVNATMVGGYTPIMVCIKYGRLNFMQDLLDANADINQANAKGNTALMVAVTARQIETVRLLLGKGADVTHKNAEDMTALDIAKLLGADDIWNLLNDYLSQKG